MRIKCPHCHKQYKIPDERLPKGKKVSFPCPNCNGLIKIDLRQKAEVKNPPGPSPTTQKKQQKNASTPLQHEKKQQSKEALKKKILRTLKDLPPMPQVVFKARELLADVNSGVKQLASVIEMDQAIATKILKLANSAYYGLSGKISSIQHACVVLGYKTLGEIISVAGSSALLDKKLRGYDMKSGDLWQHSMAVAIGSRIIAEPRNPEIGDTAFSAGLIHDSGKLILNPFIFEKKELFEDFTDYGRKSYISAENHILGLNHPEIGFEICKHWHIPEEIAIAIKYHHYPSRSKGDELAYIVHMANTIVHMMSSATMMSGLDSGIDHLMYQVDEASMEFLGLDQTDIQNILEDIIQSLEKISQEI